MLRLLNSFNRRGAMFGLDARVALITFSALAIITGSVIYKVAGQTRVGAAAAELDNISKAFGDYIMDVGAPPARIEELISSSAEGWNGPYVPYTDNLPALGEIEPQNFRGTRFYIQYYADDTAYAGDQAACVDGNCWGWIFMSEDGAHTSRLANEKWAEDMDIAIDGELDFYNGSFRCEPGVWPDGTCCFKAGSVKRAP